MADNAKAIAEAQFKKAQRLKDEKKAADEYQSHTRATRNKTERLRALRLAKEAADLKAKIAKKPAPRKKRSTSDTGLA